MTESIAKYLVFSYNMKASKAGIAQLAEQIIRND